MFKSNKEVMFKTTHFPWTTLNFLVLLPNTKEYHKNTLYRYSISSCVLVFSIWREFEALQSSKHIFLWRQYSTSLCLIYRTVQIVPPNLVPVAIVVQLWPKFYTLNNIELEFWRHNIEHINTVIRSCGSWIDWRGALLGVRPGNNFW